jgi:ATP-dependent helicase HrpA
MRLFAIKFRRELTSQVNHLPGLEQACIQLAPLVPASALRDQLRDLIARVAFVEQQTALHTKLDFEARAACATRQISLATQDLAAWLPKLATHYHTLRLALETAPAPWREVADDIQSQIVQLTDRQFLKSVAWQDLREYPRYLQAAVMRWEKLRSGGIPKDRKLREPIERLSIRYRELVAKAGALSHSQGLQQARWLIEELRVSIFAQQLGTRHSVSVKRIDELLSSLA